MSWQELYSIGLLITLVSGPFIYIWKMVMARIDKIELKMEETMSKDETRQQIQDKLEPISDQLIDIKTRVDALLDHLINKSNK